MFEDKTMYLILSSWSLVRVVVCVRENGQRALTSLQISGERPKMKKSRWNGWGRPTM